MKYVLLRRTVKGGGDGRWGSVTAAAAVAFSTGAATTEDTDVTPFASLRSLEVGRKMTAKKDIFGYVNGAQVDRYTLSNGVCSVQIISYGATLISLEIPDKRGRAEEITVNYSTLDDIIKGECYYGATCGRVANRVANGSFSLNGERYQLAVNNGPNSLHGGRRGFDKYIWNAKIVEEAGDSSAQPQVGVELSRRSEDGEEGYPGSIDVRVTISLDASSALTFGYACTNVSEKSTPVNLTNHTYWNLSGNFDRSILDHDAKLHARRYTPADSTAIPDGRICAVSGALDLTKWVKLRDKVPNADGFGRAGIDHNYVLDRDDDANGLDGLYIAAELYDEESGRYMSVETTEPGIQCYTMNWASEDPKDHPHTQHNAICFEAQHYPDSINKPEFPSTVLHPGETYRQTTTHRFFTGE
eukprot:g3255.t1